MRSYRSLNSRIINASVKNSNLVANGIGTQYLGNVSPVSSGGTADLSSYALLSYVDASLNRVNNSLSTGSTGYSRSYIDASFGSVYTKTYIDGSLNNFYPKTYIDGSLNNFYPKTYIDGSLNNVYRKAYIDASFGSVYTKSYIDASFGSVYTKTYVDGSLNNFYPKTYVDGSLNNFYPKTYVDGSLNNFYRKAYIDASFGSVYTKSYIDASFGSVYTKSYIDASFGSVYTKTYVDGSLNNFYPKTYVDGSLNNFYRKAYIDASFGSVYTKSYIDTSFSTVVVQNTSSNVTLNGKLLVASDASLNQKLFVALDASFNQKLFVGQDVSLNQNLNVSGKSTFGKPPAAVAYELDISGQVRIYEPSGSNITTSASVATLTLEHGDSSGCSSIMFKSPSTATYGDYAYIKYQDLSGATSNSGLLTVGIEKDQTAAATADKISLYTAGGLGYVGVNTLNPLYNLDIFGNANVSNTLTTNSLNTTTTTSNLNLGTNIAGTLATNGVINIGQISTTSSAGTINIGSGTGQTGAINIGSGASIKNIAIGSTTGGATSLRGGDISLNGGASGTFDLFSTSTTGGSITLGAASGNQTLTIQRPIRLVAGSDPTSVTTAIGYQMANVSTTSGVIAAPTNRYTFSTGLMTLGVGVWMVSLTTDISTALNCANYTYNMGLMTSAPTTGDSASASSAPANTISGVNGNQRNDNNSTINNGTYIYQVGGVVLNNYAGTYNSLYGIFNAKWGTGTMAATVTLRAARIA